MTRWDTQTDGVRNLIWWTRNLVEGTGVDARLIGMVTTIVDWVSATLSLQQNLGRPHGTALGIGELQAG